jgi:octaprenyl-diphosphate synthase
MTLPLIRAIAVGSPGDASLVRAAITGKRLTEFAHVMAVLERTGSLDYATRYAIRESESAAACVGDLPSSPYRESLLELASFAARRTY